MESITHDILVIGGGLAGLRAAITAASEGLSVGLVSKVYPMRSHTVSAEGGAAAVVRDDTGDSLQLHFEDTVKGSDFIADQNVVEYFVHEAPNELIQMEHWGCPWSREPDGSVSVRAFGGMSVNRTLFAADKSGFHLLHAIFQTTLRFDRIHRYDEHFVTKLLVDDGVCRGVVAFDMRTGEFRHFSAKATILATGGCGRLWAFTTNAFINTGDGLGLAYRAGAPLSDMEFPQYHPTGLPGTGILITEAARGEGGYLINKDGDRFLRNSAVASRMELGPRDMISRAMMDEFAAGRGIHGHFGEYLLLDLRHLGEAKINQKLPFVRELAENYVGIDPVREPIPVRPVVHYMMGGVRTNLDGETSIPGLYACGECAQEGLNGANRLGSNSLTECLVFGHRTARAATQYAKALTTPPSPALDAQADDAERDVIARFIDRSDGNERVGLIRSDLQQAMERNVGVYRTKEGLMQAAEDVRALQERFRHVRLDDTSKVFNTELTAALELENLLDIAETVVAPAILREESRGSQARRDFPKRDDERFLAHSMVFRTPDGPRVEWQEAVLEWPGAVLHELAPKERVY
ncbi:MAG TPA: FAD-binding protein [Chloroflexota bacterium]|nr:FAD-binding protein [Chloroflexota bacterium]